MRSRRFSLVLFVACSHLVIGAMFLLWFLVEQPNRGEGLARLTASLTFLQCVFALFLVNALGMVVIYLRLREVETSEGKLLRILESATDGVVIVNGAGRIVLVNTRIERLFGYQRKELLGKPVEVLLPERFRQLHVEHRTVCLNQSSPTSTRLDFAGRRKDGAEVPVAIRLSSMETENGLLLTILFRDSSQRQRARRALRKARASYRRLFENSLEGIFQSTADGRFVTANPALARLLGFRSPAELLTAVKDNGWPSFAKPDDCALLQRMLREQGLVRGFECQLIRRDKRIIWIALSARAVRDARGELDIVEGMVEDITERKRLEQQFRQALKMEAIGRLAGGVAHDFNNLLTAIIGYSELVLATQAADDTSRDCIEQITKAAERAAQLTRQLLAFSRRQLLVPVVLDLNALTINLNKMLRRLIGEDIELITTLEPSLHPVKADPGQIEQVIMNLAINARDAMVKGGQLHIQTANVAIGVSDTLVHPEMQPGPYALLQLTDTGAGMDEDTRSRCFEPFFTTKELGQGTGLGLATVYGIVKQSGGYIYVSSETEKGTTFKIYLPLTAEQPAAPAPSRAEDASSGRETVLLVEDEEEVRSFMRRRLQRSGYTVLEAAHGTEALVVAEQHRGSIQLLVIDVIMPGMSGRQVAHHLLRQRPVAKVLFVSGYTGDAVMRHGVLESDTPFLAKPFSGNVFLRKVRHVLDTKAVDTGNANRNISEALDGPAFLAGRNAPT